MNTDKSKLDEQGNGIIADVLNSVSENIAEKLPDIKSEFIGKIEDEIYKEIGDKITYEKRRLISAIIFKECINMNMSISDDYANIVGEIRSIFQKHS